MQEEENKKQLSTIGRITADYEGISKSYNYREKVVDGLVLYGAQNNYPSKLLRLRDDSPWNGRLIQSISDFRTGDGIKTNNGPITAAANRLGDTFQDIADQVSFDFKLFGGACFEVIWNRERTAIAEIYHVRWHYVRAMEMNEIGRIPGYFVHNNWGRGYNAAKHQEAQVIPAFNPSKRFDDGNSKQLVTLRLNNNPDSEYYPLPDYFPAKDNIILDKMLTTYRKSFVNNGINVSNVFQLVTSKTGKDFQQLVNGLDRNLSDASAAGKTVFLRVDPQNPTFHQVSNPSAKNSAEAFNSFQELNDAVIFGAGHQVTYKDLFGIESELSSLAREQVLEKSTMFFNTVIRKPQQRLAGMFDQIGPWVFGGGSKFEFMQIDLFRGLDIAPEGEPTTTPEQETIAAEGTETT